MSISEIKKINEQKLLEESDNKLTETLFSNNPHIIDKTTNINIVKIGKNKFVTVTNEKKIKPVIKPVINPVINPVVNIKKINKNYDLNDYDYDYDFEYSDF